MVEFKSNVTIGLPPSDIENLDKIAFNERVSRAEIGRRAISEYIVREKNKGDVNS